MPSFQLGLMSELHTSSFNNDDIPGYQILILIFALKELYLDGSYEIKHKKIFKLLNKS